VPRVSLAYDNEQVAAVLEEIADLSDLKGENPFRAVTFRAAARAIRDLREPLRVLMEQKRLHEIPKVGPAIAEAIEQLLTTGQAKRHEELKQQVPDGLLTLLRVPGVGPATARIIHENLKITTIDELEEAAKAGRLRSLPKIQAKTEENILRSIASLKQRTGRSLLIDARRAANDMVAWLRERCDLGQVSVAGSVRRWRETIGDVDIVVGSAAAAPIMAAFVGAPSVDRVLARGDTKSSVIVKRGLQIDLRVVAPDQFGAALMYFTGSKDHNVRMRGIALKRKLLLNEYGLFRVGEEKGGTPIAARTKEIEGVNRTMAPCRVLVGSETDIRSNGKLDYDDATLDLFEVVTASVHSSFAQPREAQTKRIVGAMEHRRVNAISHPTGRLLEKRDAYDVDLEAIIAAAVRTKTRLEVNGGPERLDLSDVAVRRSMEVGAMLVCNSDAHAIEELDQMEYAVATARRGWATKERVQNTMPLAELLEHLKGKG